MREGSRYFLIMPQRKSAKMSEIRLNKSNLHLSDDGSVLSIIGGRKVTAATRTSDDELNDRGTVDARIEHFVSHLARH